ncbi:cilia- and flagella-associated protein 36 [Periophthalmus magnuspinnatus]|uniref:cilia- and flagella-associated protein 36 n=1 Tax=Periophthalmus magnuspinnatus TaxID=409849 RepID=UPI00145B8E93|nr:cilia- and flagella-associated protein 36 [Periophthalmus magnuspinnatus]
MAEDDSEWVLESIVGFLGSPEWVIPVTDFMENKCTVFDDEEENKLSYTEIHQQYKNLVEKLLENYMQEVGINEQQFLYACTSPFAKSKTLQIVFQPVLATDDFQMFRSLMVQKNMELQLQALRVMKERNGELPECLTHGADVMTELQQQEMKILHQVLQKSKEEYEEEMSFRMLLDEENGSTSSSSSDKPFREKQASTSSQQDSTAKVSSRTVSFEESKAGDEDGDTAAQRSSSTHTSESTNGVDPVVLPVVRASVRSSESPASVSLTSKETDELQLEAGHSEPCTELSESEQDQLQQRATYLRQQRDRLHALKKEQQKSSYNSPPEEAPSSPTAAPTPPEISAEEKKRLQKRKHLAEKLKEEVIKK